MFEIEKLKSELYEQERKYSMQIESLYHEKQMQEKQKSEKIEYINSLMTQIQTLEKNHQEAIFRLQSDFSSKESTYLSRIEEHKCQIESSS